MNDLSDLDLKGKASKGAVMELAHPHTGAVLRQDDGSPITITLAGQDSEQCVAFERKLTDKRLRRAADSRRVTLTAASVEDDRIGRVAACTLGWSGIAWDGSPKEQTPENTRELFTRWPWAMEQAERFIEDRGNFLSAA
ncbi:hypothetical protein ABIE45_000359 [Methylobacterium sp. OAE515]|uniref:hypothetical protein n=1 Tax=Methylobacterium sp. OAE515 TaxID=2817895 RepID=UPI00178A168F